MDLKEIDRVGHGVPARKRQLRSTLSVLWYYYDSKIKEITMGQTCITGRETRNAYRMLMGKPVGKHPLRDVKLILFSP
jgi:hypothetical protein